MIMVEGWVRMAPEEINRLRPEAVKMMQATKAVEPGCLEYAYALDLEDDGLLRVIERWADEAALTAHFATAHMAEFTSAMAGAKIIGASIKVYAGDVVRTLMEQ